MSPYVAHDTMFRTLLQARVEFCEFICANSRFSKSRQFTTIIFALLNTALNAMSVLFFANFSETKFLWVFLHFSEPLDFCENLCSRKVTSFFIATFSEAIHIFEMVLFSKIFKKLFEISGIRNFVSLLNPSKTATLKIKWQQFIN